jgi:2-oxoglutarate ferredoxin oxidoreductase subunit alpha
VVIALVQRLGPSTGGATQGAQGDVLLAEFCTSGGYTIPMFAPSSARECYELAQVAFHWAERLRTPVVLLSDKEVGMTLESVDVNALPSVPSVERALFTGNGRYRTYACEHIEEPPPFVAVGGAAKVVATGSAHDADGRLRKNTPEVIELLMHLQVKIAAHAEEMALVESEPVWDADTLVVSYGITARAAREACRRMRQQGRAVSFLQLKTLFPVPVAAVRRASEGCSRIIVAEENLTGLYAGALEAALNGQRNKRIVRVNSLGSMITPAQIIEAVESA